MKAAVLFWVRTRTRHTPAHIIASQSSRRTTFWCGNTAEPGGSAIDMAEAKRLRAHVCVSCGRLSGVKEVTYVVAS